MTAPKISMLQAVMLLLLAVGISNHVLIMPSILQAAGRDAWISGLIAILPALLWCGPLYLLMRTTGQQPVFEWLCERYPAAIVRLLMLLVVVYLLATLYISVRDTTTWTRVAYLPQTPPVVVAALLLLCGLLAALSGIGTLAVLGGLLLPFVILLGWFVMTVNSQFKDYHYLRPMLEHGVLPVGRGAVYALGGLFELGLLLFLQQHIGERIRLRSLLIASVLLAGLTVGPTTGAIALFGPAESMDLRYPAFEQWRMVLIGRFISHLDFFSIYQWIAGSLTRTALVLFLLSDLLRTTRIRRGVLLPIVSLALFLAVVYIPISDMQFISLLYRWYYPSAAVFFAGFPVLLLVLAWIGKGGKPHEAVGAD